MTYEELERAVKRVIAEARKPRPPGQEKAWALQHQGEMIELLDYMLQFIKGARSATVTVTVMASELHDAVSQLLERPAGRPRGFLDESIDGMSPELREKNERLGKFLEDDWTIHAEPSAGDPEKRQ